MKRKYYFLSIILALLLATVITVPGVMAAKVVGQVQLPGGKIAQFVDPLPSLHTIVDNGAQINLAMTEFQSPMMPTGFVPAAGTYSGTWVWGYRHGTEAATETSYIGPVIIATRNQATTIKYTNNLPTTSTTNVLFYPTATDQSLHWANPKMDPMMITNVAPPPAMVGNPAHYSGAIPAVPHLHGGEQPAAVDGGPEQWFTSDGTMHGKGFYSRDGSKSNYAIFTYPNVQQSAPLWFHDHTLGATRLNVYAGLAGAYVLTDPVNDPTNLPQLVPMVIQDRMFDTNGQLFFPSVGINPDHPYWVPEFLGDTICVNGEVWPYLNVNAQRYRLLLYNGSNARTYEMSFVIQNGNGAAPAIWQIGTDGGYLDAPVMVPKLVLMPGERADIIVDFAGLPIGTNLILQNTAKAPYPGGAPVSGSTTGRIMQFRVNGTAPVGGDTSFNPAAAGVTLRGGAGQGPAIQRIANTNGTMNSLVTVAKTRELTLNEIAMPRNKVGGVQYPGGPVEILVNNTNWRGSRPNGSMDPMTWGSIPDASFVSDGLGNKLSETPDEGTTEIWEIVNTTMDAHPIHLHLIQFQLLNRQNYNMKGFMAAYGGAFPGGNGIDGVLYPAGVYIPGWGPPKPYDAAANNLSGGKYGGNPDVTPFLMGAIVPPNPNETGWKDTIMVPPNMVTRIAVRWGTQDPAPNASATAASFVFLPNDIIPGTTAHFDYVWHCHIIDHEDNEMMRPDMVIPNATVTRSWTIGVNY